MKLNDAINEAMSLRPSEVTRSTMIRWLSALDGQMWQEIVSKYIPDDDTPAEMPVYDPSSAHTNPDTVLMIPAPYDLLYIDYLVMRIDLQNADYERYNNGALRYREEWQAWADWFNRNHTHVAGQLENGTYYNWALSF